MAPIICYGRQDHPPHQQPHPSLPNRRRLRRLRSLRVSRVFREGDEGGGVDEKKLSTPYPPGLPPDLRPRDETDRLSSASRPPPRHVPPPPLIPRERVRYGIAASRACVFENTLTSRFARFSISPSDSPPTDCVRVFVCMCVTTAAYSSLLLYVYVYYHRYTVQKINILGETTCPRAS